MHTAAMLGARARHVLFPKNFSCKNTTFLLTAAEKMLKSLIERRLYLSLHFAGRLCTVHDPEAWLAVPGKGEATV
jgi:hypothetical protein